MKFMIGILLISIFLEGCDQPDNELDSVDEDPLGLYDQEVPEIEEEIIPEDDLTDNQDNESGDQLNNSLIQDPTIIYDGEKILGNSCGTVSPEARSGCCEQQNEGKPHIMCVGSWQFNLDSEECEFICRG